MDYELILSLPPDRTPESIGWRKFEKASKPDFIDSLIKFLGGYDKVVLNYRTTGHFMGLYLTDGRQHFLPADFERRFAITTFNHWFINSGNCIYPIERDTILL